MISPVIPELASDARNTPVAPTSFTSTFRCRGARSACDFSISLNPEIPRAARVLIGPAEMAFTRILRFPRSYARYRTVHSKTFPCSVDEISLEFFGGSKGNAVHQHMQLAIMLFEFAEEPVHGIVV